MANPAPYSKPRRSKLNRKTVVCKTAKGSRVYAPAGGVVKATKSGVVVVTKKGVMHRIRNVTVRPKKRGQKVKAGAWIAKANGNRLRYKRIAANGAQWDAMPIAKKDNNKKSGNWMPGVTRMPNSGGGDMSSAPGSERKVVWHTTESDHKAGVINSVARYTTSKLISYHVLWNPATGEFVQTYPADVAARSLMNAPGLATNRHGQVCIQISIVGRGSERPLKRGRVLKGRRKLLEWLDGHGIPRDVITSDSRSVSQFTKSGHTNHRSAPGNDHTDFFMTDEDWNWLLRP